MSNVIAALDRIRRRIQWKTDRRVRWKICWVIVMTIALWSTNSPPALAAPICRTIQDHNICILSIKRSAKNFWEYNAAVSIDDKRGPKENYNCRSRYKTLRNGSIEYFDKDSIGSLVCKIYKPTRKGMPSIITME